MCDCVYVWKGAYGGEVEKCWTTIAPLLFEMQAIVGQNRLYANNFFDLLNERKHNFLLSKIHI